QRLKRDTESGRAIAQSSGAIPAAVEVPSPARISSASRMPVQSSTPSQPAFTQAPSPAAETKHKVKWNLLLPIAAGVLVVLAGLGMYLRSRTSAKLTEKDSVLLADFVNTTGDPVFDGTLKQA